MLKMLKGLERLSTNPAVIAAIVTGIATIGAGLITSRYSEDQIEANLIIEAVKVCDKSQATRNITALLQAGFLPQHYNRLETAVNKGVFEKLIPPVNCPHAG
jgi:hypothetical protein